MSGESSFRIQSKAHRERSQPASRKKFGLLEKHKDYVERSTDYKKKKNFLKTLKTKASERNPDEFYFNMHKSQVVDGIHKKLNDTTLGPETIKLLKTQDLNYILHKKAVDDHKIEKLKSNLHLIGKVRGTTKGVAKKTHKIFVQDESELSKFELATHFDTDIENVENDYNRVRKSNKNDTGITKTDTTKSTAMSTSSSSSALSPFTLSLSSSHTTSSLPKLPSTKEQKKLLKKSNQSYRDLNQREKRSAQLTAAMTELALQRNLMGKGTKRKLTISSEDSITGKVTEKVVYKWKRERSR